MKALIIFAGGIFCGVAVLTVGLIVWLTRWGRNWWPG